MDDIIYLDHAATTPVAPAVLTAMMPYFAENFYNPSAQYLAAKSVHKDVEAARGRIAHWLGARPAEITFAAGGTEANNLAIHGIMGQYKNANIVVSAVEHDAVLEPAGTYERRIAPVYPDGTVRLDKLAELIDENTVLVSIMYANNEIGTIQPLKDIAEIIRKKRTSRNGTAAKPLYFHTDACQASAYLDLHVSRLGVDMMTINGSKIYGPKQVGALYVRAGMTLTPLIKGGGQERDLRSGTENVPGIIGFAAALDLVQTRRSKEVNRLHKLQKLFVELLKTEVKGLIVNGSQNHRLPNNVHVTIPGADNERLMMQLDERGIQVAVGSACSASSEEPSHVLRAIGMSDEDARASLRMTMGHNTTEAQVRRVVEVLSDLVG